MSVTSMLMLSRARPSWDRAAARTAARTASDEAGGGAVAHADRELDTGERRWLPHRSAAAAGTHAVDAVGRRAQDAGGGVFPDVQPHSGRCGQLDAVVAVYPGPDRVHDVGGQVSRGRYGSGRQLADRLGHGPYLGQGGLAVRAAAAVFIRRALAEAVP